MSEQQTYQGLPGALEQRVASLLQAFDAQGNHRTGTAVDTRPPNGWPATCGS